MNNRGLIREHGFDPLDRSRQVRSFERPDLFDFQTAVVVAHNKVALEFQDKSLPLMRACELMLRDKLRKEIWLFGRQRHHRRNCRVGFQLTDERRYGRARRVGWNADTCVYPALERTAAYRFKMNSPVQRVLRSNRSSGERVFLLDAACDDLQAFVRQRPL
jgi:hypothetical protein